MVLGVPKGVCLAAEKTREREGKELLRISLLMTHLKHCFCSNEQKKTVLLTLKKKNLQAFCRNFHKMFFLETIDNI